MTRRLQRLPAGVVSFILVAWALLALIGASPYAELLSHHVIGESLSPALTLGFFMAGWLLMSVAMMLPSTLPTLVRFERRDDAFWVSGYLAVWLEVGLLIYGGDLALHTQLEPRFPLASVWLSAALLLAAGLYQFTPLKRRCLAWCAGRLERHRTGWDALASGWRHGLACAGSCWALMLVMSASSSMNLAYMLLLGAFMAAEKRPRWGRTLTPALGAALLCAAGVTALRMAKVQLL